MSTRRKLYSVSERERITGCAKSRACATVIGGGGPPSAQSKGLFFITSLNELRFISFELPGPLYNSQLLDGNLDEGDGESVQHIEVDQVTQEIFTLENYTTSGGGRVLKKRAYTNTAGVITMGATSTLAQTAFAAPPFLERISLSRNNTRLYTGTGGAGYSIFEKDYAYTALRTMVTETGTRVHWMVVDEDSTFVMYRRFGLGLDINHNIRTIRGSDLNKILYFQPPTSLVGSSHQCAVDALRGKAYEMDDSLLYEVEYPVPQAYFLRHAQPGGNGAFALLPHRQKLVFGTTGGEIFWRDLDGNNEEKLWEPSHQSLGARQVTKINGGVA